MRGARGIRPGAVTSTLGAALLAFLGLARFAAPPDPAHAAHAMAPPEEAATGDSAARDRAWREDLQAFDRQLRTLHPRPFARTAEARFDSALASLAARIPALR